MWAEPNVTYMCVIEMVINFFSPKGPYFAYVGCNPSHQLLCRLVAALEPQ